MSVYDVFLYDGEEILDLRILVMWDYVDFFVIVESEITFSRNRKKLLFDHDFYRKYADKICYIVLKEEDFLGISDGWDIEFAHRDLILDHLIDMKIKDNDTIIFSDVDEIINPGVLHLADGDNIFMYKQMFFNFYGNYACITHPIWVHAISTSFASCKKFGLMNCRLSEKRKIGVIKFIDNGGWHFSYLGGLKTFIDKNNKFIDGHVLGKYIKNFEPSFFKDKLDYGIDLFNRVWCWGCVENFHLDNNIVKEWFLSRPDYLLKDEKKCSLFDAITVYKVGLLYGRRGNSLKYLIFNIFLKLISKVVMVRNVLKYHLGLNLGLTPILKTYIFIQKNLGRLFFH